MSTESEIQLQQKQISDQETKINSLKQDLAQRIAREETTLATMQSRLADLMSRQADEMRRNSTSNNGALDDLFG